MKDRQSGQGILWFLIVVLVATSGALGFYLMQGQDELERNQKEQRRIERTLSQRDRDLERSQRRAEQQSRELYEAQSALTSFERQITQEQSQIADHQQLEQQLAELKASVSQQGEAEQERQRLQQLLSEIEERSLQYQGEIEGLQQEKRQLEQQLSELQQDRNQAADQQSDLTQRLELTISELVARGSAEQKAFAKMEQQLAGLKKGPTILSIKSSELFSTGSTSLSAQGRQLMDKISTAMKGYPQHQVRVIGHTDSQPLAGNLKQRFNSNWDLSAARASAAIHYLQYSANIAPERIELVGRAHYRPLASDATAKGRKRNRRLEIQLLPPDTHRQIERLEITQ